MQHHNLEQNSLKLSRITEEKLNHSIDGINSARGANSDEMKAGGTRDDQQ